MLMTIHAGIYYDIISLLAVARRLYNKQKLL